MRTVLVSLTLVMASLALMACHTAQPAAQTFHRASFEVQDSPTSLMQRLRADAARSGLQVHQTGPSTLAVDFGQQTMRVPVPTEYGLWGSRVSFRNTRVRTTAVYEIEPRAGGGSVVTLFNNPAYWHPDIKVWLPGPYDIAPGADLLETASRDSEDG